MTSNKQYGLQIPKKNTMGLVQKHSVFGDDSDSDKSDGGGTDWTKRALKAGEKTTVKRQTKIEMQRALDEDTTVYQYDEVYDQLQKGKGDKSSKGKDRKPKYIEKLLVSAEKRKIENERRIERQVQKEREAEGDEFKDKETFVTSAYKKKLEEFAKLDAEQKRQDMLEEIGDVTKQQDMGGFYRHLYSTTVDTHNEGSPTKVGVKEERESPQKDVKNNSRHSHSVETSPPRTTRDDPNNSSSIKKSDTKKDNRKYRKRKDSESSTDKNKDADTDVGSSSSSQSSSSDSESGGHKSSQSETENPKRLLSKRNSNDKSAPIEQVPATEVFSVEPEVSIWEKRTVGPIFDAALKRYLERKNARLSAGS